MVICTARIVAEECLFWMCITFMQIVYSDLLGFFPQITSKRNTRPDDGWTWHATVQYNWIVSFYYCSFGEISIPVVESKAKTKNNAAQIRITTKNKLHWRGIVVVWKCITFVLWALRGWFSNSIRAKYFLHVHVTCFLFNAFFVSKNVLFWLKNTTRKRALCVFFDRANFFMCHVVTFTIQMLKFCIHAHIANHLLGLFNKINELLIGIGNTSRIPVNLKCREGQIEKFQQHRHVEWW